MYYHTLNCGFKTRLSGETDCPCITDARVGQARSYFKPEGSVTYDNYVNAIRSGRAYVSDGKSHIMDFAMNGQEVGTKNSVLQLNDKQNIKISAEVASYLPVQQDIEGESIAKILIEQKPYWDIERARIGKSRKVRVELIVNGVPVDTTEIITNGQIENVNFDYSMARSGWVALRIFPSSHSNPTFVEVGGKSIAERKSAEWCLAALEQCWKMKEKNIRVGEKAAAAEVYEKDRLVYREIIKKAAQ